jgi:hypothetical protein
MYSSAVAPFRRSFVVLLGLVLALGSLACKSPRQGSTSVQPAADAGGADRGDGGRPPSAADDPMNSAPDRDSAAEAPPVIAGADAAVAPDQGAAEVGPRCGNGVLEATELCDGTCPTTCPGQGCSVFALQGAAATCNARCVESGRITACTAGDGCCPPGCTSGNDSDCSLVCGTADGVCPSGCVPSQDVDCKRAAGDGCLAASDCVSGSCVDNRCCVQSCAACQSCTGGSGTCTNIPEGIEDIFPTGTCSGSSRCDGEGRCRAPCSGPGTVMCTSEGSMTCGQLNWGFEDVSLPAGVWFETLPRGSASALALTTTLANSGSRSVTTTVPRDSSANVIVDLCGDGSHGAPLLNRNATAYYYLDRSGPVGASAYLRIKAMGFNAAGTWRVLENLTSTPAIRQWTKIAMNFQDHGTRGVRIVVELYTGTDANATTTLYVDDVRVE